MSEYEELEYVPCKDTRNKRGTANPKKASNFKEVSKRNKHMEERLNSKFE